MNVAEKALTKKEEEVLNYIMQYREIYGLSPTITEIAEGLYTSRTYVRNAIYILMERGLIKYNNLKRRSIIVGDFEDLKN